MGPCGEGHGEGAWALAQVTQAHTGVAGGGGTRSTPMKKVCVCGMVCGKTVKVTDRKWA